MREARPGMVFTALCVVAAAAIAAVVYSARTRLAEAVPGAHGTIEHGATGAEPQLIYFRTGIVGPDYGKIAHVELRPSGGTATTVENLECEVVHASAATGVCLAAERGVVTSYSMKIFSLGEHQVRTVLPLAGVPSRARVAADGRYAAATVFLTGHGYDSVDFTTQTLIVDLHTDSVLADVESFSFASNGEPFKHADFNIWGVTFAPDGDTFFATLSTQRRHLLIQGDIPSRTARVIYENVECPSVSPDGTRVAYKKRFIRDNAIGWELHVLDLETMAEIPLAEERSVDDQLEWLDDNRVLYSVPARGGVGSDVWVTAADGAGGPSLFVAAAYSPAVVR